MDPYRSPNGHLLCAGRFCPRSTLSPHWGSPYLAILEILILLSAPLMVSMMAAVHAYAPLESKTYTRVALGFMFLGLSLLFAAPAFKGAGIHTTVRLSLIISGALCIAGLLGPALGNMPLQRLGILGYSVVFPVVCLLLAVLFRRSAPQTAS